MGIHNCAHHDHGPGCCKAGDTVRLAQSACLDKGVRLTEQRRLVLELLAEAEKPVGAYDLIDAMREKLGRSLAPIAIYRALDFLREHGFIHKLETLNAFMACPHAHGEHERVVFLICETCGKVEEATDKALNGAIETLADAHGFHPRLQVMELAGHCAACPPHKDHA